MTESSLKSVLFDPGYAQHTTILSISSEYIYAGVNQFKNFGQKKMKFKMLYPQLLKMVDNNVGFCMGSLLWAVYIKNLGENIQIEGNPCIDGTYDKEEAVEEVDYSIAFYDKLKKDAKYYLGVDYEINPLCIKVLEIYKEFLTLNCSFVNTKTTSDVQLPRVLKTPSKDDLKTINTKIQEVIKSGNLLDLTEVWNLIHEG